MVVLASITRPLEPPRRPQPGDAPTLTLQRPFPSARAELVRLRSGGPPSVRGFGRRDNGRWRPCFYEVVWRIHGVEISVLAYAIKVCTYVAGQQHDRDTSD